MCESTCVHSTECLYNKMNRMHVAACIGHAAADAKTELNCMYCIDD